jgi:hypothetical protein
MSVPWDTRCSQVQTLLVINMTLGLVTSCWTIPSYSVLSTQQLDTGFSGLPSYYPLLQGRRGLWVTSKTASIHRTTASIHRTTDKVSSRKPVCSWSHSYALGPELCLVSHPPLPQQPLKCLASLRKNRVRDARSRRSLMAWETKGVPKVSDPY